MYKNPIYWSSTAAIASFIVLFFTGILLSFWYEPAPERAYESIIYTSEYIYFGSILLSLHHWATHLLLISLLLHMLRIFFTGTYKKQRETWVSGALLLIVAVLFVFTGYLLRWDEIGYWTIRVTTSIVGYAPLVGSWLEKLIFGGDMITSRTLARFYMLHIALIPPLSLALLLWRHRRIRIGWAEAGIAMIVIGFLMLYSVLAPFELAPKPSAELQTPLKPIWLFLWLYAFERSIGVISPALNFLNILVLVAIALLFVALPYLDSSKENTETKRRRTKIGIFIIAVFLILTLIGYLWKAPI